LIVFKLVRESARHLPGEETILLEAYQKIILGVAFGDKSCDVGGDLS
jgi:hypothetical protein